MANTCFQTEFTLDFGWFMTKVLDQVLDRTSYLTGKGRYILLFFKDLIDWLIWHAVLLLGRLLWVDLKNGSQMSVCPSISPSIHKKLLRFQWNLVCRYRSTSDAWRYAVWPDPRSRSRSRALESQKFGFFQRLISAPIYNWGCQMTTDF